MKKLNIFYETAEELALTLKSYATLCEQSPISFLNLLKSLEDLQDKKIQEYIDSENVINVGDDDHNDFVTIHGKV